MMSPPAPSRPDSAGLPGSQETLRRLQAVTDAALSGLDIDALLAELLERTRDLLQADTAAILLLDPAAGDLVATASSGLDDEIRHGLRVPLGAGFAGRIAATREPLVLDHVDTSTVVSTALIDQRLSSMAGVPMLASGELIGVLHVGTRSRRDFTAEDIDLLRLVADRAALATQARLSQLDRASTLALQRSLLPARPPAVAGFDVAARYIPGAAVGVGGDWYDLFTLPSGYIGVAIGDVAGSGLRAAVVMGRIRSALRAYALESDDPADVLTRLDRKIQLFEPDAMATAIYAVIAPDHTTLSLSYAGHLPPLLIDQTGKAITATVPVDLPLGAYANARRRTTAIPIDPGTTVLFYTDGLVERRDRSVADGIAHLRTLLCPIEPNEVCATVIEGMLGTTAATDDVAVLVLRRVVNHQPPPRR
jgi:sigma-B regulation protein RsbU (phosphoserine phosphatase)